MEVLNKLKKPRVGPWWESAARSMCANPVAEGTGTGGKKEFPAEPCNAILAAISKDSSPLEKIHPQSEHL
jgi:hypothetical protein